MSADSTDIWTLIAMLGHKNHAHHWETRADEIRALLDSGADPNAGREPPLLLAAQIGHRQIAQVLLNAGADVQGGNAHRTPLHAAGKDGPMRSLLLAHDAKDTPFSLLASGDVSSVRSHVQRDSEVALIRDEADKSLLFYAAALHDLPTMKFLLDAGADPNAVAIRSHGISPIHEICRGHGTGGASEVHLLHSRGADLNATDDGGVTALHMAVRDRNVDAVRSLLELGASVDIEDRGRKSTPLRRAVANTGRSGTSGKTVEALEIVRLLLRFGADPEHTNRTGKPVIASTTNAAIRRLLSPD